MNKDLRRIGLKTRILAREKGIPPENEKDFTWL
jgi:hypothetical protein